MPDQDGPDAQVGKLPADIERGEADLLEKDQHIRIRRSPIPTPPEDELDDGPDVDHETGEYKPAVYKTNRGNIRKDN